VCRSGWLMGPSGLPARRSAPNPAAPVWLTWRRPEPASSVPLGPMARHWRLPDPCRCGGKVGSLASILQRGTATRCDRQQGLDHADEIGGRHQPVTLSEGGKLCLWAVQRWGSDHIGPKSNSNWIGWRGQRQLWRITNTCYSQNRTSFP
jgi:hypothetical protein